MAPSFHDAEGFRERKSAKMFASRAALAGVYVLQLCLVVITMVVMVKASQKEATSFHVFSAVHSWLFCLTACVLVASSRKPKVCILCAGCAVGHVLVTLDMYYQCGSLVLVLKMLGLLALPLSILTMRKKAAVLVEVGASRGQYTTVTPCQVGLTLVGIVVSVINHVGSSSIFFLTELVVWFLLGANLWYHFLRYNRKLNTSFGSFVLPGSFGSANGAPVINLKLRKTKAKLKSSIVTRVFMTGNIQIVYFVLLNAFWGADVEPGKCSPRFDDLGGTATTLRFVVGMSGLVVLHFSWLHMVFVAWLEASVSRLEKTKKSSSLHTLSGSNVVSSDVSRSSNYASRSSASMSSSSTVSSNVVSSDVSRSSNNASSNNALSSIQAV